MSRVNVKLTDWHTFCHISLCCWNDHCNGVTLPFLAAFFSHASGMAPGMATSVCPSVLTGPRHARLLLLLESNHSSGVHEAVKTSYCAFISSHSRGCLPLCVPLYRGWFGEVIHKVKLIDLALNPLSASAHQAAFFFSQRLWPQSSLFLKWAWNEMTNPLQLLISTKKHTCQHHISLQYLSLKGIKKQGCWIIAPFCILGSLNTLNKYNILCWRNCISCIIACDGVTLGVRPFICNV